MKSLLIEDTTVDERMQIVKEALGGFGNCDCEGIDMDDMYDDYIFGRRELADINREFSQQHAGAVKAEDREKQSGCGEKQGTSLCLRTRQSIPDEA